MRAHLTRRRERRILEALRAVGPLDEWDLYQLLNAHQGTLNKALLNLATSGQIAAERSFDPLWLETKRKWRIAGEGSNG